MLAYLLALTAALACFAAALWLTQESNRTPPARLP